MDAASLLAPVLGSATRDSRRLLEYDAAVRVPLPLCRRLGFVQLGAGSGASTTAARVVGVLASRRAGRVLAVDASSGPYGLLARAGVVPVPAGPVPAGAVPVGTVGPVPAGPGDPAGVRSRARTAAEAGAGLGRGPTGCYGQDLRAGRPGPAGVWSAAVGPIARFHDVVATDWGPRQPGPDLEPVLTSSHAVCLVVRADAGAVRAASELLRALAGRPAPPVVVALVALDRGARAARLARQLPGPVVPIGYAPGPRPPGRRHRVGCIRLAAELMRVPVPLSGGRSDR